MLKKCWGCGVFKIYVISDCIWIWYEYGFVDGYGVSTDYINGIFLPKLFWPTVRKNCSSDREKVLKFEAEGREFAKFLRSLEQFIQTVKGQNNFW